MNFLERIYSFVDNIRNVIKWIPIIWNDRDYSQHYMYKILYFKFKSMEELHNSEYAYSANSHKVAHQLRIAKNLAYRLWDGKHFERAMLSFDRRYGSDVEIMHTVPSKDLPGCYDVIWTSDKVMLDAFSRAGDHSRYMERQDKEYLFRHMAKYIDGWWD